MNIEIYWRLGSFSAVLIVMGLAEFYFPRRAPREPRKIRWTRNLSVVVLDNVLMRLLVPITAAGVSVYASRHGFGLFNSIEVNSTIAIVLAVIILDLAIYAQHVLFHWNPLLWRLHKVHHIDHDLDVSTGIRFHPIEILLSTLIKCGVVFLLGVPFLAVVIFEVTLNAAAMFNHSNVKLPLWIDTNLRKFIVTPDMHRVHHSTEVNETHSNFGFNLAIWDRIFGTYIDQPKHGHEQMTIGLPEYQDSKSGTFLAILKLPFIKKPK